MLIKRIEPIYNMKKENHNQDRKRKSKMKNKNTNQVEKLESKMKQENVYCNYNSKGELI